MTFKKITALFAAAAIMAASSAAACAESVPAAQTVQTDSVQIVERELGASAAKTWDGKSALEAGTKYVLKKSVTISKKVEIPKGTTLTLNKGVKLGIGSKGALNIRGTLAMKSGSTLSVSGRLYTYSGSKISDSGAIKLNKNKANVTIGGTFTVNKSGSVSGTPKSIKLGKKAKVTIKGKNTCKKLSALLDTGSTAEQDKKEIAELLTKMEETVFIDGKFYDAITMALPEKVVKKSEEEFAAAMKEMGGEYGDMTMSDFYNELYNSLLKPEIDKAGKIKSVTVTVVKLSDCTLTDEEKALFDGCGDIEKSYTAEIKADVDMDVNPDYTGTLVLESDETAEVNVVKIGGKWYLTGTSSIVNGL